MIDKSHVSIRVLQMQGENNGKKGGAREAVVNLPRLCEAPHRRITSIGTLVYTAKVSYQEV